MSPFAVAVALGLAEADAVDDRGVIERVGNDGVLVTEQCFEQPAVGVEARAVEDRVFGPEEPRIACFEVLCMVCVPQMKRTDESPNPIGVERALGGSDQSRVSREPQVVVGAEILEVGPSRLLAGSICGALGRGEHALFFVRDRLVASR